MGDRHGGRFARRGRALSPPRRNFPTARHGFPMPRGGGQDLPRARRLSSAKASRHGAKAKRFAPREKALLGESLQKRRTSERICPAQEHAPRRKPPDTAHERKDLPRAGTRPSAKASRHGARAKGFTPAGTLPSAKASRHGARAKGFTPAGTLPSAKASRHGARAKRFTRARRLSSAKASRHGARAKGFVPRGFAFAPRADERRAALDRRTAGKTPLRRGRTRDGAAAAEFIHTEKKTTP